MSRRRRKPVYCSDCGRVRRRGERFGDSCGRELTDRPAAVIRGRVHMEWRARTFRFCPGQLTTLVRYPATDRLREALAEHVSGKRIARWLREHDDFQDRLRCATSARLFRDLWSVVCQEATR